MNLPFEIRKKIWLFVIGDLGIARNILQPRKHGKKFVTYTWPTATSDSASLPMTCRQLYVE